jgi:drug/metabolite transporter (DMT)-like permease
MVLQAASGHAARAAAIIPARTGGASRREPPAVHALRRACDTMPCWRGEAISQTSIIWIGAGFVMAASWGVVTVVNKRLLEDVHPVPLNFLVRGVAIGGLIVMTVPLTMLHLWPYGFGINAAAFWYIAVSACVTWLVAFSAYYYALRAGSVGVVAPVTSTDPLWTAVFSLVLLGVALQASTLVGMAVTILGVVLISRWMEGGAGAMAGPADGALTPLPADLTGPASPPGGALLVVSLSLIAAAGWGFSPVLVQMAEESYGEPSAFMMLESQLIGMLSLGAFIAWRRAPLFTRRLATRARRRMIWLLLASGALEALFSVLFYLVIENIGAVLAMLLASTSPVFGIAAGMLFLKERLSARLALAVAITMAGVVIATAARLF